jgi:hypothetical protein
MLNEPDVQRLLKQIRKTYKAQTDKRNEGNNQANNDDEAYDENVEDIEATGAIAGKALETVIRKGI